MTSPVPSNPLAAIAHWCCGDAVEALSPGSRDLVGRALLDTIAVTLLGSRQRSPRIVARIEAGHTSRSDASLFGLGRRTALVSAALVNGTSAHADLFDDNNAPMIAHPSAPLLSALLPLAQVRGGRGRDVVHAYAVGFEVGVKLGRMLNPKLYEQGWHATRVLGVLGTTAACARLLRLDAARCMHALGIAASLASGIRQNFGTMTMALHVGLTARDAIHAALLAEAGFESDAAALHGNYGFFPVFGRSNPPLVPLGEPFELDASGIIFKPFPSGAPTHAAVDAALALRAQLAGDIARIERVTCYVHPWNRMTLRDELPLDPLQAKVNLRYCVAAALVRGRLSPAEFTQAAVEDATLRELAARIDVAVSDALPDSSEFPAEVELSLADGTTLAHRTEVPPGGSTRPLARGQLVDKLHACAHDVLATDTVAAVVADVDRFDGLADVRAFCARLEGAPATLS